MASNKRIMSLLSNSRPLSAVASWFTSIPHRHGNAGLALLCTLFAAFVSAILYLCEAENPWGKSVQRRLAKGQPLQFNEIVISSLWWAVLASTVLLFVLLITHRLWLPKANLPKLSPNSTPSHSKHWWWKLSLFTALALCLWQSAPRLSQSLWNDEEYAMRRFAHGEWKPQSNGSLVFEPVSWKETLFYNRNSNNHLLDSTLTRTSLSLWRFFTGEPRASFSESAVRLPSLLAGLGSLCLVAALGARIGHPLLGVAAAILLSLLPWHVHYSSDGKGYAELMFFILLQAYALLHALDTNRIRWWLLFALAEAAYLLCFPAAVYVAILTNLFALTELFLQRRLHSAPTLIAFNLIGAIPVIIWAAPSIPQVMAYFSSDNTMSVSMNIAWLRDLFSSLYLGFGYHNPFPQLHHGTSWSAFASSTHWLIHTSFALILLPLLILTGLFLSLRKNFASRLAIATPILAASLSFAINSLNQSPMVVWHFVFILPSLTFAISLAISLFKRPAISIPIFLSIITIYAWSVAHATQLKRQHDRQPIRQTADWINLQSPDSLVATWGVSDLQSRSYIPRAHVLKSLTELTNLQQQAQQQQIPLYVFFCGEQTATTQRNPDLTQHVRHSGQYQPVADFPGLEELFSYLVFQWQPPTPTPTPTPLPEASVPSQSTLPDAADP